MNKLAQNYSIQSYIDNNREKLDESLVSLRVMKEIDNFLDYHKISNKELAAKLGYSESYISQLMSGIKNVNISFINKFEKQFNVKLDFNLYINEEKDFLHKLTKKANFQIININLLSINPKEKISFIHNNHSMINISNLEQEL